jgi:hypothetical protein
MAMSSIPEYRQGHPSRRDHVFTVWECIAHLLPFHYGHLPLPRLRIHLMSRSSEAYIPQSDGIIPIHDELAAAKRTLNVLQSRISQLETQLEELQEQVRAQRNIIFPIQSLPTEILGPIFLFVVPDVVLDNKCREALLQLNLVCGS